MYWLKYKEIKERIHNDTHPRMRDEVVFERERHLALVAAVRPLGRVQQQMRVEAVLASERLAAVAAHVGPLTCHYN